MKESTIKFIKKNKAKLSEMFNDRVEELKETVFIMAPGEERDMLINFVKEYKVWLRKIDVVTQEKKEKDPEYI